MVALQDLLRYCAVALVLQVAISMLNIATLDRYDRTAQATVAQVAAVLIAAVPSSIPTVISFSLFRCMISLKKRLIEVHHVRQLKTVAAVDCCVFDKTGTLTGCVVSSYQSFACSGLVSAPQGLQKACDAKP